MMVEVEVMMKIFMMIIEFELLFHVYFMFSTFLTLSFRGLRR
jgi:hypothetical protein